MLGAVFLKSGGQKLTIMNLNKRQLKITQQALGYAVMYAKTEQETAEFALMKLDIDEALIRIEIPTSQVATGLPASTSLDGCPFHYCDKNPKCEGNCRYNNGNAG